MWKSSEIGEEQFVSLSDWFVDVVDVVVVVVARWLLEGKKPILIISMLNEFEDEDEDEDEGGRVWWERERFWEFWMSVDFWFGKWNSNPNAESFVFMFVGIEVFERSEVWNDSFICSMFVFFIWIFSLRSDCFLNRITISNFFILEKFRAFS